MQSKKNINQKIVGIFHKIENFFLIFFLSLMVVITFLQIILRTFFRAIEWFDPLVRYSVLWVGMIASGMATFRNKHIRIDIIGRFAKGRLKSLILSFTNLFGAVISIILSYASFIYIVQIEMPATDPPPFLNIPRWILLTILPVGFGLMGIRFLLRAVKKIINYIKNEEDEKEELE